MRKTWPVVVSLILFAGCGGGTGAPPFKPVVDTKLLMQAVVDPNADIVWEAVKSIDTRQGSQEIRPKSDEEWTAVRNAADICSDAKCRSIRSAATIRCSALFASSGRFSRCAATAMYACAIS